MMKKADWIIHYVSNSVRCVTCVAPKTELIPGSANIHTHGMEKYKHLDFQLVLNLDMQTAGYILNTLGERVRDGERFKNGDYVKGIFLDCDVRLETFREDGRKVLRVIIPDQNNIFPDEPSCNKMYQIQMINTDDLYIN